VSLVPSFATVRKDKSIFVFDMIHADVHTAQFVRVAMLAIAAYE
jgi:hypothetical protein